jgi:hypothetical protein
MICIDLNKYGFKIDRYCLWLPSLQNGPLPQFFLALEEPMIGLNCVFEIREWNIPFPFG